MKNRGAYGSKRPITSPKSFGERLRQTRVAWGWSQAQLADALGSNQRLISHWERDVAKPSAAALASLSRLLGLPAEALCEGRGFSIPEAPALLLGDGSITEQQLVRLNAIARLIPEVPAGNVLVFKVQDGTIETESVASATKTLKAGVQAGEAVILVIRKAK